METITEKHVLCPSCHEKGKRVGLMTLRSLLKPEASPALDETDVAECCSSGAECRTPSEDTGWRFCESQNCDVAYFAETMDQQFEKSDLRVVVGVKESTGARPLCYCFGHSVASIKEELSSKGHSNALEDIRAKMKDPGCRCEKENPSGSCCLGSVGEGIRIACEELG